MSNKVLVTLAIGVVGLVLALYVADQNRNSSKPMGSKHPPAPELVLTDLDGQKLDLANYKGQVVLVDFWATWCDPCRAEIPNFVRLQDKYRQQGFRVIGISMDDGPDPVRDFYQKFKMNYPVAMGNARLAERFGGILGLPVSFLIGRDGRVYVKHVGETDASVLEREVQHLLASKAASPTAGS